MKLKILYFPKFMFPEVDSLCHSPLERFNFMPFPVTKFYSLTLTQGYTCCWILKWYQFPYFKT